MWILKVLDWKNGLILNITVPAGGSESPGIIRISDVIDKMTENVEFADRFMNKNGSLRKTPLKKKRAISKLEFFFRNMSIGD